MNPFGDKCFIEIEEEIVKNVPLKSQESTFGSNLWTLRYRSNSTSMKILQTKIWQQSWAFNMRKIDGTEYKESALKIIWNLTAKLLQEKYFVEYKRSIDPFKEICFQSARKARDTKRKALQAIPEQRKRSSVALTLDEVNKMVTTWDENTPVGLQRNV